MATIFRSPVFVTVYKLPKAQPEYTVSLQTLYAPNPDRPFRQLDWPLAARPKPPQDAAAPANLNPLIYPNPQRPFHQDGWDRPPLLPKAKATGEVAGTLNSLFTPNPSRPFSQAIWDSARTGWPKATGDAVSGDAPRFTPNPARPFSLFDWPRAPIVQKAKSDDFANLLPGQTVVVVIAPFLQGDWPNTAKRPSAAASDVYACPATLLAPNPSTPFSQRLWENAASQRRPATVDTISLLLPISSPFTPFVNPTEHRVFARQDVKSDIFVNFLPLRAVTPPAPPFAQFDWANPQLARRSDVPGWAVAGGYLGSAAPSTDQFTVSGRSVQDLFTPASLSYPSHVTRQTN